MADKLVLAGVVAAGVAIGLMGTDLLARLRLRRFETVDPEEAELPGARFWVRGVAVHYVEQGAGFPVVLVHGFGGSTLNYRHLIPALAEHFRVIAIDLPGFGYSDRGDHVDYSQTGWVELLREFLQRFDVERAVFIGHSMGGGVVQRLAVAAPELVERLILVGAVSAADPRRLPSNPIGVPVMRAVQALASLPPVFRRLARSTVYDAGYLTEENLSQLVAPAHVIGSATAVRSMLAAAAKDPVIDLGRIQVPTLLIWGERDRVVRLTVGEELLRGIAGSRLEVVDQAGHMVLEEQPDASAALILNFLADLADQDPGSAAAARAADGAPR